MKKKLIPKYQKGKDTLKLQKNIGFILGKGIGKENTPGTMYWYNNNNGRVTPATYGVYYDGSTREKVPGKAYIDYYMSDIIGNYRGDDLPENSYQWDKNFIRYRDKNTNKSLITGIYLYDNTGHDFLNINDFMKWYHNNKHKYI